MLGKEIKSTAIDFDVCGCRVDPGALELSLSQCGMASKVQIPDSLRPKERFHEKKILPGQLIQLMKTKYEEHLYAESQNGGGGAELSSMNDRTDLTKSPSPASPMPFQPSFEASFEASAAPATPPLFQASFGPSIETASKPPLEQSFEASDSSGKNLEPDGSKATDDEKKENIDVAFQPSTSVRELKHGGQEAESTFQPSTPQSLPSPPSISEQPGEEVTFAPTVSSAPTDANTLSHTSVKVDTKLVVLEDLQYMSRAGKVEKFEAIGYVTLSSESTSEGILKVTVDVNDVKAEMARIQNNSKFTTSSLKNSGTDGVKESVDFFVPCDKESQSAGASKPAHPVMKYFVAPAALPMALRARSKVVYAESNATITVQVAVNPAFMDTLSNIVIQASIGPILAKGSAAIQRVTAGQAGVYNASSNLIQWSCVSAAAVAKKGVIQVEALLSGDSPFESSVLAVPIIVKAVQTSAITNAFMFSISCIQSDPTCNDIKPSDSLARLGERSGAQWRHTQGDRLIERKAKLEYRYL
jgi:hypothetical protein